MVAGRSAVAMVAGRSVVMIAGRSAVIVVGRAGPKASKVDLAAAAGMKPPWPPKAEGAIHVDGPVAAARRMRQERGKLEEGGEVSTNPAPRLLVWHRPRLLPQTALVMATSHQGSLQSCRR